MAKDKFGYALGTARSKAAAAYENGMTIADSAKFSRSGKPLRNLLADAAKKGHQVFRLRLKPTDRAPTYFLIERGKTSPAAVLDAKDVELGTPTEGKGQSLTFKPWKASIVAPRPDNGNAADDKDRPDAFDEDDGSEPTPLTFTLESDLQKFLRANLDQLEPGLKEIDGGREQNRRDITAKDTDGNVVVIELKAGKAMPDAIAQITAYMSEAMSEVNQTNLQVRGILIAADFHEKIYSSRKVVPDLQLIKYRYQFSFEKF